jgi:hypothetical protein
MSTTASGSFHGTAKPRRSPFQPLAPSFQDWPNLLAELACVSGGKEATAQHFYDFGIPKIVDMGTAMIQPVDNFWI